MSGVTDDPTDPKIHQTKPNGQNETYLVLSEEERAKGFVQPVRTEYVHLACGASTKMGLALSETYARDPKFYDATFCVNCGKHFPLWKQTEGGPEYGFVWVPDGQPVGDMPEHMRGK